MSGEFVVEMPEQDGPLKDYLATLHALPPIGYDTYHWALFQAFYDPRTDHFYWADGEGSSNSYLWNEYRVVADLKDGDRAALVRAVRNFCDDHGDGWVFDYPEHRFTKHLHELAHDDLA